MNKLNTEKSKALHERALQVIPGAASSVSRTAQEGYIPYPLFIDRAEGARLYDVDGNKYIDYLQALGPTLVGHANPRIINFVAEQMQKGTIYGLPYEMQIDVAEKLIRDVPSFEKVSFMNSGTEVVQMALRLARAYTQKDIIAKFEGNYHGWLDNVAISVHPPLEKAGPVTGPQNIPIGAGIPKSTYQDMLVLPWNDLEVLEQTIATHKEQIAGIIVDPCACNAGIIPPAEGFLEALRELTAQHGILLIFDEVITGFRLGLGGAQEKFGVTPDLTTMAKAMGGGFPIGVYGGRADIMDLLADASVLRAGTLNANRVAIAAAYATLEFLEEDNGRVYQHIYRLGDKLIAGIRDIIRKKQIQALVQGFGSMFQIHFTPLQQIRNYRDSCRSSGELFMTWRNKLLEKRIFIRPAHFGELYVTAAHTDEDIDRTLRAMEDVLGEMKEEKLV